MGLNKDSFEELLRKSGIPCQYFCRKSFATWDVLFPTEQQAAKAAERDIITKNFRLQPEYQGTRRLRVTICNVPAIITGEVLAAYLSAFGQVEEFNLLRSPAGTAYGDYAFRLCLTRDGFKPSLKCWSAGIGRWLCWWREDAPGAGGVSKLATSPSFAPSALKTKKKKLRQQQQQQRQQQGTQQPPSPTQSEKKRIGPGSSPAQTKQSRGLDGGGQKEEGIP